MLCEGCLRRHRGQESEIDRLVQEFGASGLVQKKFEQQVDELLLTVDRWMRPTAVGPGSHEALRVDATPALAPKFGTDRVRPTSATLTAQPPG